MKRKKNTTSRIVRLANDVIRPGFWTLSRKKELTNKVEKRRYKYGDCMVVVYGRLYEEDRGTFICLLEMAKQHNNQPFDFNLSDITKEKGLKNPWTEKTALRPARESIDRLLDAQIRIRPTNKVGLRAKFSLIEGWLDSDDTGNFNISPYMGIVRDLALGTTNISLNIYFSIKSQIARSLYNFLSSQRLFYTGKGYEIRLSLLVKYLGYDVQDRPWWQIWPYIEKAIEELKRINFVGRYVCDKTRHKTDGGMLKFYPVKKELKELSTGSKNSEVLSLIKQAFPDQIEWTEGIERRFRIKLNQVTKFLEQYHGISFKTFITNYTDWLKYKDLKFVSPTLFDPDNMYFLEFIKNDRDEGRLHTKAEYKRKYPESDRKPLTQEQKKDLAKRRKEHTKEREKKRKQMKCPHGYEFGKDFDEYGECVDCELMNDCDR